MRLRHNTSHYQMECMDVLRVFIIEYYLTVIIIESSLLGV